jgi:CDP-diacylglycerol--glycerol-3-phosphate 3-phosphatidyltransferase
MDDRILTIPNILTLSRLPLAVLLFASVAYEYWLVGLIIFALASLTDWLDGFLARRLKQQSAIGRNLDPLIDKVLVGGAFIYLMPVKGAELLPWMVTVVIGRELLITGLRGMMEAQGVNFGADQLGKLKMALQCVVLIAILAAMWLRSFDLSPAAVNGLFWVQIALIYLMLLATVASGLQYILKAVRLWRTAPTP